MKENGKIMKRMVMLLNIGYQVINIKGNILMVWKMEEVDIHGSMVIVMKELMLKIRFKVLEHINGQMVKNILVSGWRIKCMVKAHLNGQMGIDMLEIIKKIKKMDKAYFIFQMVKL